MKTVHEVSRLSGVSVRTLHHYDAIGLLPPSRVTEAGYRLYDEAALARLREILLYREAGFPLKEIRRVLDSPDYDRAEALRQQYRLLLLERERLDRLLALTRDMMESEVTQMDFSAFDKSDIRRCSEEARQRWGHTDAYRESERRAAGRSEERQAALQKDMMRIFADFGAIRGSAPDAPEAQALAERLRGFISANYYDCTEEIFAGLGELYGSDGRFRENIDRAGGEGTALFVSAVIRARSAK